MNIKRKLVSLSNNDLLLLNNALNEILNGPGVIDDREFQTRIGLERSDAQDLLHRIQREIEKQ